MVEYGMVLIAVALVFGGLCYSAISAVNNFIIDDFNNAVGDGDISASTASHFNNCVKYFKYIMPMFIVGLCVLFGLSRAQYEGAE